MTPIAILLSLFTHSRVQHELLYPDTLHQTIAIRSELPHFIPKALHQFQTSQPTPSVTKNGHQHLFHKATAGRAKRHRDGSLLRHHGIATPGTATNRLPPSTHHHALVVNTSHEPPQLVTTLLLAAHVAVSRALRAVGTIVDAPRTLCRRVHGLIILPLTLVSARQDGQAASQRPHRERELRENVRCVLVCDCFFLRLLANTPPTQKNTNCRQKSGRTASYRVRVFVTLGAVFDTPGSKTQKAQYKRKKKQEDNNPMTRVNHITDEIHRTVHAMIAGRQACGVSFWDSTPWPMRYIRDTLSNTKHVLFSYSTSLPTVWQLFAHLELSGKIMLPRPILRSSRNIPSKVRPSSVHS